MTNRQAAAHESWLVRCSLSLLDLAICIILTTGGSPFCSHEGYLAFCPCPSYCFPSVPIPSRFPQGTAKNYHPTTTGLQQEPTPQSPLLEIAPPFPPHSILPQSYPKGTCSFNRPQCSSLNRIRASVEYVNSQLQSHQKSASQFLWPHAQETRPGDT